MNATKLILGKSVVTISTSCRTLFFVISKITTLPNVGMIFSESFNIKFPPNFSSQPLFGYISIAQVLSPLLPSLCDLIPHPFLSLVTFHD